jgi:hypothetical protein
MRIAVVTNSRDGHGNLANGMRVLSALRALGHDVQHMDHHAATDKGRLERQELILCFGTVVTAESQRPGLVSRIRAAKSPGAILAMWYFDLCNPRMKNSPQKYRTMTKIAPLLDWLFMTDGSHDWSDKVPHAMNLMQGVDSSEFVGKNVAQPESRLRDVIFTGGFAPPFQDRLEALRELRKHFSVGVFGRNSQRRIYGDDFYSEHQKSRVVFVPTPPREAPRRYWSNRIYLATATGTPCVVGWTEGLDDHFQDERDVLYFRTPAEMVERVAWFKADPELRARIGMAGRTRTLEEHTYLARSRQLMEAITQGKEHVNDKSISTCKKTEEGIYPRPSDDGR